MTHLMRLELKKVGLKKYVIFSMIGIFISMYFLFVGLNDSSTIKSNYETAFSTLGMIFCVYYITLFSVLVATYIINEYNHKTILVMFSYPIDRRKLMIAKLLLITLLVMFSMIVGYICCGIFIVIADKCWELIEGEFRISVLSYWIPTALKAIITFCTLGIGTFVIGMIKKSVPMTIISAIVFFYIRQFYIAGMDLYEENWLFVIGVVVITIIGVWYVLTYKINQTD
ncbi:lantibiotic ABC transporter permease [Firmicutes bacterium AM41-5BH]|nr:lantibiotic ABC transporter permease [Firmicutes bacterium AM41-5BH]